MKKNEAESSKVHISVPYFRLCPHSQPISMVL